MIHITDRTLSLLDDMPVNIPALAGFLKLLIQCEPDAIELSGKMYDLLSPLPDYPAYMVRIDRIEDTARYPRANGFVCHGFQANSGRNVTCEILLNDMRDLNDIACCFKDCGKIRVQGLDDILTGDYLNIFSSLRESFSGGIEFCPADSCHFATALTAEWLANGGSYVVTSFAGMGGFAATEEVIMILKLAWLRKPQKAYTFFPEMTSLLNKITAKPVRRNKPVLGRRIFHVESGIHVDGILKDPKCYEPFPPEEVGLKRKIVIGKQSGTASIRAKLDELGIPCVEEKIPAVLEGVRTKSGEKRGALSDREFSEVVRESAG